MSERTDRDLIVRLLDLFIKVVIGLLAVVILVYSLLVAQQLLVGVLLVLVLILTYVGVRYIIRKYKRDEDARAVL